MGAKIHGILSVLISNRGPHFTSIFWRELWKLLETNLCMGSRFHPESFEQGERLNQLLEQILHYTMHQLR